MFLWILLGAHFVADFSLQSTNLAERKTESFRWLVVHALIYAIVVAGAIFLLVPVRVAWIPFLIIIITHFIIDAIRVWLDKKLKKAAAHFFSFVIDQILHVLVIYASVCYWELNGQIRNWLTDLASTVPLEQILRYVLIFILILDPAAVFVKKLSSCASSGINNGDPKNEPPVGRIIGKLERIITVILVLYNEIGAIGFVLTAKSLARYKQLDNQNFAEKYLVGTLSSTAFAIVVALLLR